NVIRHIRDIAMSQHVDASNEVREALNTGMTAVLRSLQQHRHAALQAPIPDSRFPIPAHPNISPVSNQR
ncbi:hypothetical protein, partial [Xanthomonas arboricola]|uniref:hypothetical protein n=1 Tax=Xanthomonas arboricola TaxID=56448 RepID=UPI001F1A4600